MGSLEIKAVAGEMSPLPVYTDVTARDLADSTAWTISTNLRCVIEDEMGKLQRTFPGLGF